ncbi:MAG: hypothetical protein IKJ27_03350, partial [Clostridia bacterium]|nr:hypothetical protein [Clostridia bacterium]
AIFCGADFWQDKTQNAVNPIGFTSILTKYWRKSARKKRGSDYARHPTHFITGKDPVCFQHLNHLLISAFYIFTFYHIKKGNCNASS